ncbi:MAG: hypothetical protein KF716_25640 [Anaerolineae bacterium]|nr:hypothetical protein [Anaerolineae bacterium]
MTNKADIFTYHAPHQLQTMSLAELEALWDLVPTERQRQYRVIYDRYVRSEGAVASDTEELAALAQLIDQFYVLETMVPVLPNGDHWVRVPKQIREAAETNIDLAPSEENVPNNITASMLPVIAALGVALIIVVFFFIRGLSQRNTADGAPQALTPTRSPTPGRSPTPTPIALEAQDSIIRGGDASNSAIFPVNLRIAQAGDNQPRFFVVQRRLIQTTEWSYDPNPDIASYVAGLSIRPVIGIPWSEANVLLFEYMLPGTIFDLQMNTGSTLRFQFSSKQSVNRSDTSWFRQLGPGLALVLIGERDATTGELTSNRVVVTAGYDVEQELSTAGDIVGIDLPKVDPPTPTATSTPFQRIDVNLISAESTTGWVKVKLRIYNGRLTPIVVDPNTIQIAYGYAENPVGPTESADLTAFELASGQAVDLTITFAWQGEPYCTLSLFDYRFSITLVRK